MIYLAGQPIISPPPGLWLSAASAVVVRNGDILIGLRHGSRGADQWGLPGGSLNPGEGVLACAQRELFEETGMIGHAVRILAEHYDELEGERWRDSFVLVEASGEPALIEPHRCREWRWSPVGSLPTPFFDPFTATVAAMAIS